MRKVITAAAVAIALVVAGHGHTGSVHTATRARSVATAPATTRRAPTTTSPKTTHPSTTAAHHAATPSTVPAVTHKRPARKPPVTTTTSNVATVAALRARALQMCLELAATNNYRVVAANGAWYDKQLRALEARGKKSSALYNVLLVEQSQTKDLIDAQFTIDQSNCYIKYA